MAAVDVMVQVQCKGHDLAMTIGGKTTTLSIADWLKKNHVITDKQLAEFLARLDEQDAKECQ